jgi:hypothetical protein
VIFPLAPLGPQHVDFSFIDQRCSPCTMTLRGIDSVTKLRVKLTVTVPFRPRDLGFSTIPVIALRLEVERMSANFRWQRPQHLPDQFRLILAVRGGGASQHCVEGDAIDLHWQDQALASRYTHPEKRWTNLPQHDRLFSTDGIREDAAWGGQTQPYFRKEVDLSLDRGGALTVLWATHQAPVLRIHGERAPFHYAQTFPDLGAVCAWGREQVEEIFDNARRVDAIIAANDCGPAANHLLAYTLHSWLMNTWCVRPPGSERPHFTVWEGCCYYHSTVDVEYTQAPFYLAVWPELLEWQLDQWCAFTKPGDRILGPAGADTRYLSHDMGDGAIIDQQHYPHDMPVEETTNWLILAWCHHRRSGERRILDGNLPLIRDFLAFIAACDSTGSGIPDLGVANTIDDGAPAIQYGRDQIYLAVKVLAAYTVGAEMLDRHGETRLASRYRDLAAIVRKRIGDDGWAGDHFVTILDKRAEGLIDPWTKNPLPWAEVPGWNAAHIYTVNGLALLDFIGLDLGLDSDRLVTDLRIATARCLTEYGCTHTDFANQLLSDSTAMEGLAAAARNPGWVSMNMLRDFAAFRRGVDLRPMAERYWSWQLTCNTQDAKMFHETFNGNDLCHYPRGIAWWGLFEALAGRVADAVDGRDDCAFPLGPQRCPDLLNADWRTGSAPFLR